MEQNMLVCDIKGKLKFLFYTACFGNKRKETNKDPTVLPEKSLFRLSRFSPDRRINGLRG